MFAITTPAGLGMVEKECHGFVDVTPAGSVATVIGPSDGSLYSICLNWVPPLSIQTVRPPLSGKLGRTFSVQHPALLAVHLSALRGRKSGQHHGPEHYYEVLDYSPLSRPVDYHT